MSQEIDYLRINEEISKILPGEVITQESYGEGINERVHTQTRSTGSDGFLLHGDSWSVQRPSGDDIAVMVGGLFAPGNTFAILSKTGALEPSDDNDICVFVQTALADEDDLAQGLCAYVVETQFLSGWDKSKAANDQKLKPKQFRLDTNDTDEVKEIFKALAAGTAPDVASWKDVTAELSLAWA